MSLPELRITDRDGKKALWIGPRNVWSLQEDELTPDVLCAIRHAYELGRMSVSLEMRDAAHNIEYSYGVSSEAEWKEEGR